MKLVHVKVIKVSLYISFLSEVLIKKVIYCPVNQGGNKILLILFFFFFLLCDFLPGKEKSVKWRAMTEEHARDSFENLLFSVCRFRELTGKYPHNITVSVLFVLLIANLYAKFI